MCNWESPGKFGTKISYHRHNGVSVRWVNSFVGEYFVFLTEYFATFLRNERRGVLVRFAAEAAAPLRGGGTNAAQPPPPLRGPKPRAAHSAKSCKISAKKQNITKNEFIIQRKHRYPYNKWKKNLSFFVG